MEYPQSIDRANWNHLRRHITPRRFQEGKFGIINNLPELAGCIPQKSGLVHQPGVDHNLEPPLTSAGLHVQRPAEMPCDHAYFFMILRQPAF